MLTQETIKHIPEPTLRRLPGYHHLIRVVAEEGQETISCSLIGRELNLDPTQVRKDLAMTGVTGKPKVGYDIHELMTAIEDFLGWNNAKDAFLAGAGNLGQALLTHQQFNNYGLNITAAFDVDRSLVGTVIAGKEVLPLEKLAGLARRMHILMGIITVPPETAQIVADQMVAGGIKAIWNFAPISLSTPPDVMVQNEDLFASLAVLSRRLTTAMAGR